MAARRLIDADTLIEAHYDYCNTHHGEADVFWAWSLRLMKDAPTIEAEPVRRGRWVYTGVNTYDLSYGGTAYEPTYRCSACGHIHESYVRLDEPIMPEDADYPNYCPNCGARMESE